MPFANRILPASALFFGLIVHTEAADVPSEPVAPPEPVATDEWQVSLAPYFWATFYEGDMTINGQTVDMSGTNVFDLLSESDFSFPPLIAYIEARNARWGGYLDVTYLGLDFPSNDFSLGPGPVTAAAGLDFLYALVNAGLIYTAAEWQQPGGSTALDLMVGGRYTHYDVDLAVTVGPVGASFSETINWWDITLGGRLRGQFDNGWKYNIRGDIAGAGLESDFSVQALANIGRDFQLGRADMTAFAGYRFLYQDWSDGNDAVDLVTHGPMVGLSFNF